MSASSSPSNYSARLQPRDIAILRGLFEARVMNTLHIAKLYFEGRVEAAKKRVQKLKASGLIAARPRKAYDPAILFLTKKAFLALIEGGHLRDYPHLTWEQLERRARVSPLTLAHELAIMDVKAALCFAVAGRPGFSVEEFLTWPVLYQFKAAPYAGASDILIKPDGYIRIREFDPHGKELEHRLFLELDRSTEPQGTLVLRAGCYRDYYRRGGLASRFGARHGDFEQFPFRVLMVFRTKERRNNTAERLLLHRPPILTQVWLTTLSELITDPLGSIWVKPTDYRAATRGTPYDPTRPGRDRLYRTQPDREALIERKIRRCALFEIATKSPANGELDL